MFCGRERYDCDVGSGVLGGIYGGRKVKKTSRWGLGQRSVWATLPFFLAFCTLQYCNGQFLFYLFGLGVQTVTVKI